jgi:hypothetical protein
LRLSFPADLFRVWKKISPCQEWIFGLKAPLNKTAGVLLLLLYKAFNSASPREADLPPALKLFD